MWFSPTRADPPHHRERTYTNTRSQATSEDGWHNDVFGEHICFSASAEDLDGVNMGASNCQFAKKCGAASHLSKLYTPKLPAMKSALRIPARHRPCSRVRSRQSANVEFSTATSFTWKYTLGHVCNECAIRLREANVVHDASCDPIRPRREDPV